VTAEPSFDTMFLFVATGERRLPESASWLGLTLSTALPQKWRQQTQIGRTRRAGKFSEDLQSVEAEEVIWLPPRDSNPDMLIQSQISPSENKEIRDLHSAKGALTRQNTHTGRTRKDEVQS
jgi:hypothetical protein